MPTAGNDTPPGALAPTVIPSVGRDVLVEAATDALNVAARLWAAAHPEHLIDLAAEYAESGISRYSRTFVHAAERQWVEATGL